MIRKYGKNNTFKEYESVYKQIVRDMVNVRDSLGIRQVQSRYPEYDFKAMGFSIVPNLIEYCDDKKIKQHKVLGTLETISKNLAIEWAHLLVHMESVEDITERFDTKYNLMDDDTKDKFKYAYSSITILGCRSIPIEYRAFYESLTLCEKIALNFHHLRKELNLSYLHKAAENIKLDVILIGCPGIIARYLTPMYYTNHIHAVLQKFEEFEKEKVKRMAVTIVEREVVNAEPISFVGCVSDDGSETDVTVEEIEEVNEIAQVYKSDVPKSVPEFVTLDVSHDPNGEKIKAYKIDDKIFKERYIMSFNASSPYSDIIEQFFFNIPRMKAVKYMAVCKEWYMIIKHRVLNRKINTSFMIVNDDDTNTIGGRKFGDVAMVDKNRNHILYLMRAFKTSPRMIWDLSYCLVASVGHSSYLFGGFIIKDEIIAKRPAIFLIYFVVQRIYRSARVYDMAYTIVNKLCHLLNGHQKALYMILHDLVTDVRFRKVRSYMKIVNLEKTGMRPINMEWMRAIAAEHGCLELLEKTHIYCRHIDMKDEFVRNPDPMRHFQRRDSSHFEVVNGVPVFK